MGLVCYCNNVTEEEIYRHVAILKCCSTLQDIRNHTGATLGGQCAVMNPSGK